MQYIKCDEVLSRPLFKRADVESDEGNLNVCELLWLLAIADDVNLVQ